MYIPLYKLQKNTTYYILENNIYGDNDEDMQEFFAYNEGIEEEFIKQLCDDEFFDNVGYFSVEEFIEWKKTFLKKKREFYLETLEENSSCKIRCDDNE